MSPGFVELALGLYDLLKQFLCGLETGPPSDIVDYDKELVLSYPLLPQGAILLLTSRVENLQMTGDAVNHTLASVAVL